MTVNYVPIPNFTYLGDTVYAGVTLTYKLVLATVVTKTSATISGNAPGLLNIEVNDNTGKMLLRITPDAFGKFSGSIATSSIPAGTVSWTVYGWDSAPGQPFTNSDAAAISVVIVH